MIVFFSSYACPQEEIVYAELTLSRKSVIPAVKSADEPVVYAQIDHNKKTKRKADISVLPDINQIVIMTLDGIRETALT